jgi:cytochrome b involved in lipid metabolism
MENLYDTIGGLPLHPLTVHAAAVLIPLSALALAILVFVPRWRKTYFPLTIGFLAVSVGLSFAAKESGEALAQRVGNPASHEALGDIMFPASIGLFFLALAFYLITQTERPKWTMQLAGSLATVGVVGVVVLSVLVGHSGAEATWASRISSGQGQDLPGITDPSASPGSGITAAEVAQHNTASDCWSVVNGNVYDLTTYLPRHKGGPGVLTGICGKDGTSAFTGQHSGQAAPAADLSSLFVGVFGAAVGDPGVTPNTTLTSEEVLKHATGQDCWSVINGQVYDLTSYVNEHPGGAALINAICGQDGSAAFSGQHAGASKPANVLAAFALGPLVGTSTLPNAQVSGEESEEGEEGEDDD